MTMADEKPHAAAAEPSAAEAQAPTGPAAGAPADEAPFVEGAPGMEDAAEADAAALALAALEAERDELRKRLQYALAEIENVRKRAERDRRDAETFGGTRLARDLLSVHDNLERAMAAADEALRAEHAAFFEGVELTQRELLAAFAKHRIEKVAPQPGERFDANLHQAMFEAEIPGAEPGTVVQAMTAGFTIAGRLLRPAMVGVAKAAAKGAA
jgi:molecular chaperone GrpE